MATVNNNNNVPKKKMTNMNVNVSQRSAGMKSFKVMDILQRANELETIHGKDVVLHCEVGQPETGAPKRVAQAAIDALTTSTSSSPSRQEVLGYTDAFGLLPLRQAIAHHYKRHYNLNDSDEKNDSDDDNNAVGVVPSTSQIIVTTGSSGAFLLAFFACFDVGDVVAIASVGYPCYRNILSAMGCHVLHIPVNDISFKLTAVELRAEISKRQANNLQRIRGLILSSPSNPTGSMLTPVELQDLCCLCEEYDIQFISDEIYHGISYGSVPEATALQYSRRAIVINSFSKYYSMSGWRLGWMIIPHELIQAINSLQQNMFINAPTISQTAALHCWDDETIDELQQHVCKYQTSRALILEELGRLQPGLQIAPADGGFYVYVHLGPANVALNDDLGSVAFCQALLEEYYVAFTPGIDFEDPSTGLGNVRFRISYAGGIETAANAMKRLHEFWPHWQQQVNHAKKKQTMKNNAKQQQQNNNNDDNNNDSKAATTMVSGGDDES